MTLVLAVLFCFVLSLSLQQPLRDHVNSPRGGHTQASALATSVAAGALPLLVPQPATCGLVCGGAGGWGERRVPWRRTCTGLQKSGKVISIFASSSQMRPIQKKKKCLE